MSSTSWLKEGLQALQITAGHRDRLLVRRGRSTQQRNIAPYKSKLKGAQHLTNLVCMPIAFHVLCVLTCVRVSPGARRAVNAVSRLSRACCLLCLCNAYCCGCCDASSGDACACSSTDRECDVAPAGSGQASEPPSPNATRQRKEETTRKRRGGEHVYACVYAFVCLPQCTHMHNNCTHICVGLW